jgi:DNA-binding LacI/PurR family transcriptional regulator
MAVDTTTGSAALPNQGINAIAKSIREWGDLYQGAVVLDQYAGAEAMREWADVLGARGKKPVVYFDHTGEHESFTRKELQCGAGFYRLYLDEKSAVQLAAERLAALGHRTVGVLPVPHDNHPWVRRRIALLKRTVARDASRLSIIDAEHEEPFWMISPASNPADTAGFQEKLFAAVRRGKQRGSGIRSVPSAAEILRATPSLGSLIRKGATAIVGLNDWMAYLYLLWCIATGIDVPGELSLISFDNSRDLRQFPLSSIDFGFGRLGYLAARILCGARPDDPGGAGAIPGICTLADRGSLGPAHPEGIARGRTKAGNIALPCRDFSGHHSPGRGDSHEVYPGGLQRQDNARLV